MSTASNRLRPFLLVTSLVAVLPVLTSADEHHKKGNTVHPNNAAQQNNAQQHALAQQQHALAQQQAQQQHALAQQQHALAQQNARNQGNYNETALRRNNAGVGRQRGAGGMGQHRNQSTGPMVSSLHSVVAHLQQADHDYDGHRMKAIGHLDHAIRALQPGAAGTRTGVGAGGVNNNLAGVGSNGRGLGGTNSNGTNGARMPQAQSDAHLREAHQQLLAVESNMFNGGTVAAHHQNAHTHVQRAVQELNSAMAAR